MRGIVLFLFILVLLALGIAEMSMFINSNCKSFFDAGAAAYFFFLAGFNTGTLLQMERW